MTCSASINVLAPPDVDLLNASPVSWVTCDLECDLDHGPSGPAFVACGLERPGYDRGRTHAGTDAYGRRWSWFRNQSGSNTVSKYGRADDWYTAMTKALS